MSNKIINQIYIICVLAIGLIGCTNAIAEESALESTVEPTQTIDPENGLLIDIATANALDLIDQASSEEESGETSQQVEDLSTPTSQPIDFGIFGIGHRYVSGPTPRELDVTTAWVWDVDGEVLGVLAGAHWSDQDSEGNFDSLWEPTGLGGLIFRNESEYRGQGLLITTERPVGKLIINSFDENQHTLQLTAEDGTTFEFNVKTLGLIEK